MHTNLVKYQNLIAGFMRDITSLGSTPFYGLVCLFFLLQKNWGIFFQLIIGFILVMIVCYIIKAIYHKERPDHMHSGRPQNIFEKVDLSSFPSVHAARTAILYQVINKNFESFGLWFFMLLFLIVVAYSRVYLRRHTIVDVIGGVIIGIAVTLLGSGFF